MIFHWFTCIQLSIFLFTCGVCSDVVFKFENNNGEDDTIARVFVVRFRGALVGSTHCEVSALSRALETNNTWTKSYGRHLPLIHTT